MSPSTEPAEPRRRADAERSIARILDAAIEAINENPAAGMAEIARRAGVVRATVYVHFPTRDALLEAITHRAFAEINEAIASAEPERGDPAQALARVTAASWRRLGRFHSLIAINTRQHDHAELRDSHATVHGALIPIIERGQAEGTFRGDVPVAWHLSMHMALVHAASAEVRAGRITEDEAEAALIATVLGALAPTMSSTA